MLDIQILTVSAFKGGTGKTTLSTLLGVAATLDGRRTAGLDLDPNTRNFGSILARSRAAGLAAPDHLAMVEFDTAPVRDPRLPDVIARMAREEGYELLIIDTGSGKRDDLYQAHLLADVILTPAQRRARRRSRTVRAAQYAAGSHVLLSRAAI